MAVIHIVLFKFKPDVSQEHKSKFISELQKLKSLPCVENAQLTVGGPSVTNPIERSKGYEFALVSRHRDLAALAEYQASKEHHDVTSKLLWPFKEDVTRFDFETTDDESSKTLLS
ncbi:dimeric alpha-beta barrel [Pseudomassariella vexata]|uniref:Dimeric alpha-beta barrel n=1 Tax=Pseudomassariella vexata TaxID=1141098 RepID=A0A1Y2DR75_9PEZI|nr:dimeric alpha-beta barrel [Pseudomassariella vexata]ORY61616.1 dimeric alpha-beta barrel [Pseudomassariella vexata]